MGFIDKYYVTNNNNRVERVTENVNIKEYKAPTDESLKLLKEYDEIAKNNLLFSVKVDDNTINGYLLAFREGLNKMPGIKEHPYVSQQIEDMNTEIYFKFIFNGIEYSGRDILSYGCPELINAYTPSAQKEFYTNFMVEKLSKVIAIELIKDFLQTSK